MHLYLNGYFDEDIQQTAYSINIYLRPHAKAGDLLRHSLDAVERGSSPRIVCTFLGKAKRAAGKQRRDAAQSDSEEDDAPICAKPRRKRKAPNNTSSLVNDGDDDEDFTEQIAELDGIADDDDEEEWASTLRPSSRGVKKARISRNSSSAKATSSWKIPKGGEVIELSSD